MGVTRKWILVRGLAHEQAHWGHFSKRLAETFPNDQHFAIDLLGCGTHNKEKAPWRLKGLVSGIRQEAQLLAPPPYHLVSISLGSMLAYDWAITYPNEISGMVLMNTSLGLSPCYQRMRWQIWGTFLQAVLSSDLVVTERKMLPIISSRQHFSEELIRERAAIYKKKPVSCFNTIRQLVAAATYRGGKLRPNVPTLILSGLRDRLCHPQCSVALSQQWGIPNHVHPSAGHDLTLDDEDWVIEQIVAWLASISDSRR